MCESELSTTTLSRVTVGRRQGVIEIPKARCEWISGAPYIVYCMGVTSSKRCFAPQTLDIGLVLKLFQLLCRVHRVEFFDVSIVAVERIVFM